jgi:hypothetical protein
VYGADGQGGARDDGVERRLEDVSGGPEPTRGAEDVGVGNGQGVTAASE